MRSPAPLLVLALLALAAPAALAAEAPGAAPGSVRVAILSDTHMSGPEYPLNTENGPLDNGSITRTQMRMWRVVRALNAVTPPPELVMFGGDGAPTCFAACRSWLFWEGAVCRQAAEQMGAAVPAAATGGGARARVAPPAHSDAPAPPAAVVHNGIEYLHTLGLNQEGLQTLFNEPTNGELRPEQRQQPRPQGAAAGLHNSTYGTCPMPPPPRPTPAQATRSPRPSCLSCSTLSCTCGVSRAGGGCCGGSIVGRAGPPLRSHLAHNAHPSALPLPLPLCARQATTTTF